MQRRRRQWGCVNFDGLEGGHAGKVAVQHKGKAFEAAQLECVQLLTVLGHHPNGMRPDGGRVTEGNGKQVGAVANKLVCAHVDAVPVHGAEIDRADVAAVWQDGID